MFLKIKILENSWTELAARVLLGGIFVYGSYHKIALPAEFAKIIYGYQMLPAFSINLIAIVLPFLEFFAGIALISGIYPRSAAMVINAMLLGFILAITVNLIRGVEFDCGCLSFGETVHAGSAAQLLVRDIVLLLLGFYILFFTPPRKWAIRIHI